MTEETRITRPALPRDAFRSQRTLALPTSTLEPVVVTPAYDDAVTSMPRTAAALEPPPHRSPPDEETGFLRPAPQPTAEAAPVRRPKPRSAAAPRNPFEAYGERSSSRPYALRLPDAIDLVIRQMAAEERTHPLRIVDRILHDHLKRVGRLPPPGVT